MPRQKRIHTGAFLLEVLGAQQHALMPLDTFGGGDVEGQSMNQFKKQRRLDTSNQGTLTSATLKPLAPRLTT